MKTLTILAALLTVLALSLACNAAVGLPEAREEGSAVADSSRGGGLSAEKMLAEFREDNLKAFGTYGDKRLQVTVAQTPGCGADLRLCSLSIDEHYQLDFWFDDWESQLKFREERTASCLINRYGSGIKFGEVVLSFRECRAAEGIVAPPLAEPSPAPAAGGSNPWVGPTPTAEPLPTPTRTPRPTATLFPTPTPPTPPEDNDPPLVQDGFRCFSYSIWNQYRLELYAQETWRSDLLMDGECAAITLRDYWTVDGGVYRMTVPTGHPNGDMILDAALSLEGDSVEELFDRARRREDLSLHCEGSADTRRGYLSLVNCRELE